MRNTQVFSRQFTNSITSDRDDSDSKANYHPVPDGRFYTKANFFTMQDRNDALSDERRSGEKATSAGAVVPFPSYPMTSLPSQANRRNINNMKMKSENYDDTLSEGAAIYRNQYNQTENFETDQKPTRITLQPIID